MIDTTKERTVVFSDKSRGIIIGNLVYAPFYQKESCIVYRDKVKLVLTHMGVHRMGVSIFKMPYEIVLEPLTFRHEKIHKDSFLFWVFDYVTMCRAFSMQEVKGKFEVSHPNHFCPVFDRFGHIIGISAGVFQKERICIPIKDLL
jgi:hypothetical protein